MASPIKSVVTCKSMDVSFSHNMHFVTDRQTDGQIDDSMITIADHNAW